MKDRSRKAQPIRVRQLLQAGLIRPGDAIWFRGAPDHTATLLSHSDCEFKGRALTINDYARLVSGWKGVNIYDQIVHGATNKTLGELRDRIGKKRDDVSAKRPPQKSRLKMAPPGKVTDIKLRHLFEAGLIESGDEVWFQETPDSPAVLTADGRCRFKRKKMSVNQYAVKVSNRKSMSIYGHVIHGPSKTSLDELRRRLFASLPEPPVQGDQPAKTAQPAKRPDSHFQRVEQLPAYVFSIIGSMKTEARAAGEDVIDFGMGNPDAPTPGFIVDALCETVARPDTHGYSQSRGIPKLRKAVCDWYRRRYGVELDHESQAIVTLGSKEGLAHLALATLDRGDAVLVPNPSYPVHPYGFVLAGAQIIHVPMLGEGEFLERLDDAVRSAFPKPKMLVVNFPSNPTTRHVGLDFFERLLEFARSYGIWVVQDLAYADLCFDGYRAPSILQVPGALDYCVEVTTMSKSYNMAGWRIGFTCGNPDLIAALARIKSYLDYGAFTPIQVACIHALNRGDAEVERVCGTYRSRRRRALRRAQPGGLAGDAAEGDDVRLGQDPRALGSDGFAGIFPPAAAAGSCGGLAGHRLRRARRGLCALRADREQPPHPPGRRQHPSDVQGGAVSEPLRLGLCGAGTVGGEVHRQLSEHGDALAEAAGRPVEVVAYSARNARPEYRAEYFADAAELARRADVDAVVELIGGVDVAFEVAQNALAAGRPLITANKALLAERGGEISALLSRNPGTWIGFEAAIGGGIPVVKCLGEGLAGNRIRKLSCILNGTSNYILSEMLDSGADFGEVLRQAQERGYAEADPTLDVSGGDAAHKLAILAGMAFGIAEPLRSVTCEGIDILSVRDFRFARQLDCFIRPLAVAERIGDAYDLRVHAALVPEGHSLAGIGGVMNAVHIQADPVGEVFLSGPGAGAGATASAVLADIIDLAAGRVRPRISSRSADLAPLDAGERESSFYLRLDIPERNRPGIIAEITGLLTEQQISISELIQHGECDVADHIPLLVLTDPARERAVRAFAEAVRGRPDICRELLWLRVEDGAR